MEADWSNEKVFEFLQNYEAEPVLWDPLEEGHKKKYVIYDAWVRIKNNLSWAVEVDELKKRDSLMAAYRSHLNKIKKSIKSGAGVEDIYKTNWFAFSTMDKFLRRVYDCQPTFNTQIGTTENIIITQGDPPCSTTYQSQEKSIPQLLQDSNKKRPRTIAQEITAARKQMDEALQHIKGGNDEYELFGKLIASKLRKIKNANTREILMNDIHTMVFRACMLDRCNIENVQSSQPLNRTYHDSPYRSSSSTSSPQPLYDQTYQSPPSTSSPQPFYDQTYQSLPSTSSPQPLYTQVYQSPPSTSSPQPPFMQTYKSLPSTSSTQPPLMQTYQSLPIISSPQPPNSETHQYQSQSSPHQNQPEILPPRKAAQIVISKSGQITLVKDQ